MYPSFHEVPPSVSSGVIGGGAGKVWKGRLETKTWREEVWNPAEDFFFFKTLEICLECIKKGNFYREKAYFTPGKIRKVILHPLKNIPLTSLPVSESLFWQTWNPLQSRTQTPPPVLSVLGMCSIQKFKVQRDVLNASNCVVIFAGGCDKLK